MEEPKNNPQFGGDKNSWSNIYLMLGFIFLLVLILSLFFIEVIISIFDLFFGSNSAFFYSIYLSLCLILTLFFTISGLVKKTGEGNSRSDNKLAISMIILLAIFFIIVAGMIIALTLGDG